MMRFNDFLDAANTRICKASPDAKVSIRWISEPQEEARIDVSVQAENTKAAVSLDVSSAYRSYDYKHRNNYEYYKRNGTLENMADICLDQLRRHDDKGRDKKRSDRTLCRPWLNYFRRFRLSCRWKERCKESPGNWRVWNYQRGFHEI